MVYRCCYYRGGQWQQPATARWKTYQGRKGFASSVWGQGARHHPAIALHRPSNLWAGMADAHCSLTIYPLPELHGCGTDSIWPGRFDSGCALMIEPDGFQRYWWPSGLSINLSQGGYQNDTANTTRVIATLNNQQPTNGTRPVIVCAVSDWGWRCCNVIQLVTEVRTLRSPYPCNIIARRGIIKW